MGRRQETVQSVSRAIQILQCFHGNCELGVSEISRTLGICKSTVFGLMNTLEAHGLLERNVETGRYALGNELFRLGLRVNADLSLMATPPLQRLVELHKETVHLVHHDGVNVLYLHKIESPHSMRICSRVGERQPLYCTAVGKAILAHLAEAERDAILERTSFARIAPNTICSREALLAELEGIRRRGYAVDDEELEEGLRCVAAPVFNHLQRPMAAISVAGPVTRMDEATVAVIGRTVLEAAGQISLKLGFPGKAVNYQ